MWNRDKLERYSFMTCNIDPTGTIFAEVEANQVLFGQMGNEWHLKPMWRPEYLPSTKPLVFTDPDKLVEWLNEQEARPLAWVGKGVI